MPTAGNLFYFSSKQGVTTKPAVVLIHGAGGDHLHWPHNIRRLKDYRVIAPDLPGHGKSGGIGLQSIREYAKAICDWLTDIGISRAVFVGHSMGGAIAQTIALEFKESVQGVVLVATGAKLPVNESLLTKIANPSSVPGAIELIMKWAYGPGANKKMVELVKKQMLKTRPTVIHGDFLACNAFDLTEQVKEIKQPTLVICGEEDKMTPISYSESLAGEIKNAKLIRIPEAGHMVMQEKADQVAGAIMGFLDEKIKKKKAHV